MLVMYTEFKLRYLIMEKITSSHLFTPDDQPLIDGEQPLVK